MSFIHYTKQRLLTRSIQITCHIIQKIIIIIITIIIVNKYKLTELYPATNQTL